jgi:hypothetical protein
MTGDERERVRFTLPTDLPVPMDDRAANHLVRLPVPEVALPSTDGGQVRLADLKASRTVVYCYPRTGRPDEPPLCKTGR